MEAGGLDTLRLTLARIRRELAAEFDRCSNENLRHCLHSAADWCEQGMAACDWFGDPGRNEAI